MVLWHEGAYWRERSEWSGACADWHYSEGLRYVAVCPAIACEEERVRADRGYDYPQVRAYLQAYLMEDRVAGVSVGVAPALSFTLR